MTRRMHLLVALIVLEGFICSVACTVRNAKPKEENKEAAEADKTKKTQPDPKPAPKPEVEPKKPDEPTILDGIKVELLPSVEGRIETTVFLKGLVAKGSTKTDFCQLRVRVTNQSETNLINYSSWRFDKNTKMTDEFNNTYSLWSDTSIGAPVGDYLGNKRLDPGMSLIDTLPFEAPIDKAKDLMIRLSGESIERAGAAIVYRIPRSFFAKMTPR